MTIVVPLIDVENMINFLEEEILPRADELHRAMVRHQPSLTADDDRRKGLFFLQSSLACTPSEAKARLCEEYIRKGNWDRNRDAGIAVWRMLEGLDATETERKGAKVYWVKTDVLDKFSWEGMNFV
ncbi:hypothetical protein N7513_004060 [Penicillium frequentans]|nr:hypothetical protein N7513_004060 [Penicillium glabrum]